MGLRSSNYVVRDRGDAGFDVDFKDPFNVAYDPGADAPKSISKADSKFTSPGLTPKEKTSAPVVNSLGVDTKPVEANPLAVAARDQVKATQDQTKTQQQIADKESTSKNYLAAASFALSVMNAQSAYSSVSGASKLNIMEARRLGADAIQRGQQRSLEATSEGMFAGEEALLSLAAQGQDIAGIGVENVQGSLEDIGRYNGLQEELNGIKEALGFDLEVAEIEFGIDQAEIQRDTTILSAGLNFGASALGNSL